MPRGLGQSSSKRHAATDSPPSSSSDDSELGSVECDRSERVVTRSESRRKQTTTTWNRVARGFRSGMRSAGCRGGGAGDVVERGSHSRGGGSKGEDRGGSGEDKGKGKLVLGEDDEEKNEREGGEKVCEVVRVIDDMTLRTWEFVSTMECCFDELDKVKKLLDEFTLEMADAAEKEDDGKYLGLWDTVAGLLKKEKIFKQMVHRAAEEAAKFSSIIVNSVRVLHYLLDLDLISKGFHLYTPSDSPLLGELYQLAESHDLTLVSFTYC